MRQGPYGHARLPGMGSCPVSAMGSRHAGGDSQSLAATGSPRTRFVLQAPPLSTVSDSTAVWWPPRHPSQTARPTPSAKSTLAPFLGTPTDTGATVHTAASEWGKAPARAWIWQERGGNGGGRGEKHGQRLLPARCDRRGLLIPLRGRAPCPPPRALADQPGDSASKRLPGAPYPCHLAVPKAPTHGRRGPAQSAGTVPSRWVCP